MDFHLEAQGSKSTGPKEKGPDGSHIAFYDLAPQVVQCYYHLILFVEAGTKIHPCSRDPTSQWRNVAITLWEEHVAGMYMNVDIFRKYNKSYF